MSDESAQRKLVLFMSMSLDGFAARRDGVIDWLADSRPHSDRRQRAADELLGQTGLIVLGRHAAEDMARAWPGSRSPTGNYMNALPKLVCSSTISELEWNNARVCDRPVEEAIPELKAKDGGDIVCFGGASFARSLAAHNLIDTYCVTVQPVALGDGLPLLHGLPEPLRLDLVSVTTYTDGPVTYTYAS